MLLYYLDFDTADVHMLPSNQTRTETHECGKLAFTSPSELFQPRDDKLLEAIIFTFFGKKNSRRIRAAVFLSEKPDFSLEARPAFANLFPGVVILVFLVLRRPCGAVGCMGMVFFQFCRTQLAYLSLARAARAP